MAAHTHPQIVLASASPSRRMVLNSAGIEPLIRPADIDEDAVREHLEDASPQEVVEALAKSKAEAIDADAEEIVIGCDSMLLLNGELQGKPHTVEETIRRWESQRGQVAELITGHCVRSPAGTVSGTTSTKIYFADASDADIRAYAESGEPWECAGAFTLEALGGWFIDRIEGDPSSVIGISLPFIRRVLYDLGYSVSKFW